MTDKIAIDRDFLEHAVVALEYAYSADDEMVQESIKYLRAALAEPPSMQPLPNHDNHHNALKCPYCNPRGLVFAEPQEEKQALQKIADFGQDQERPAPSQAKSLALLDLDSVEHMQGGANGPTIRLRGFINAQTGPTAPQPPIDNAFVAEGCEQFSTPAEPAPVPCCGKYETCSHACTPRGKWLGRREAESERAIVPPGYAACSYPHCSGEAPEDRSCCRMPFTSAMADAAEQYWRSVGRFAHPLPAEFRWVDCFNAMIAAAKKVTP